MAEKGYDIQSNLPEATTQNGSCLWEVVYYVNQTTGGFFQKEVQTLYISQENIIACNNFKVNVMWSSSLTDLQINLPPG